MKVGLERVGAVVGTLLLAFALLLVNSPVRAASYVATDASSTTSSVITSASDSGAEMSVGSAVLYVIVGATALAVVIGVVLLLWGHVVINTGPLGHAKSGNSWAPGFNPQGFKMPGLLKRARV